MENDVLKNKIAPWQEHGRWYHGVYDIATQSFIESESDDFFKEASNYSLTPLSNVNYLFVDESKYMMIDSKFIPRGNITFGGAIAANIYLCRISTQNHTGRPVGPSSGTGTIDFYAFINTIA